MNKLAFYFALLLVIFIKSFGYSGTIMGAWQMENDTKASQERAVLVATANYLTVTIFEKNNYIRSYGGTYTIGENVLHLKLEFNDKHPKTVGNTLIYKYFRKSDTEFTIEDQLLTSWQKIHASGPLDGLWRITGRANEQGQFNEMKRGDRKTLKICAGNRFQWFAINPATQEFFGTGGGTYSLINGVYTETIEFFSRDNSRVGTSLSFEAKITDNQWRHTGKSSVGKPVDENWENE